MPASGVTARKMQHYFWLDLKAPAVGYVSFRRNTSKLNESGGQNGLFYNDTKDRGEIHIRLICVSPIVML